jgi:hypothetical protein
MVLFGKDVLNSLGLAFNLVDELEDFQYLRLNLGARLLYSAGCYLKQ